MFSTGKIYTVYENAANADPADRIELVREGFAFWAFVFGPLWMLANRLWVPAIGYVIIIALLAELADRIGVSPTAMIVALIGIQFWLGGVAYDIKRCVLERRGYHLRDVICANSLLMAQQRSFESA